MSIQDHSLYSHNLIAADVAHRAAMAVEMAVDAEVWNATYAHRSEAEIEVERKELEQQKAALLAQIDELHINVPHSDQRTMEIQERNARAAAIQQRIYATYPPCLMPPPSSLGLTLAPTPNSRRWDMERQARMAAAPGSVFQFKTPQETIWYMDQQFPNPARIRRHFLLVRLQNGWLDLTVEREPTESLEDVVNAYLQTVDAELFTGNTTIIPESNELPGWIRWDSATQSWNCTQQQ